MALNFLDISRPVPKRKPLFFSRYPTTVSKPSLPLFSAVQGVSIGHAHDGERGAEIGMPLVTGALPADSDKPAPKSRIDLFNISLNTNIDALRHHKADQTEHRLYFRHRACCHPTQSRKNRPSTCSCCPVLSSMKPGMRNIHEEY